MTEDLVAGVDVCLQAPNGGVAGLSYSGASFFDPSTGKLALLTSGRFPEGTSRASYMEFQWLVPAAVTRVVICNDVTVTGHFRVDHRLTIIGRDRNTSVIYGTDVVNWSHSGGRNLAEWNYSAIGGAGSGATITVKNLTVRNARSYAISGWGQRVAVDQVNLIHDRPNDSDGSNSDGVQGADGSTVTNSYLNVGDDALKIYGNMTIENVTIDLQHNGAPIQLGWDKSGSRTAVASIKNLVVNGTDPASRYNLGIITWSGDGGGGGNKTVNIDGLAVTNLGNAQRWNGGGFEPMPLVLDRASAGSLSLTVSHAKVAVGKFGTVSTRDTTNICNSSARVASYSCP